LLRGKRDSGVCKREKENPARHFGKAVLDVVNHFAESQKAGTKSGRWSTRPPGATRQMEGTIPAARITVPEPWIPSLALKYRRISHSTNLVRKQKSYCMPAVIALHFQAPKRYGRSPGIKYRQNPRPGRDSRCSRRPVVPERPTYRSVFMNQQRNSTRRLAGPPAESRMPSAPACRCAWHSAMP
jgi:hypothetical protein